MEDWKIFYLEIAKVGKWNGFNMSETVLKKALENFKKEGVIPVKSFHTLTESKTTDGRITKMRLSKGILSAKMELKGNILEKWTKGELLKPSIELQKHQEIGWNISRVALLGEESPGVKGLKRETKEFEECQCYEKIVFCDIKDFENKNNIDKKPKSEKTMSKEEKVVSFAELKKDVEKEVNKTFSEKISKLEKDVESKEKENKEIKEELLKFQQEVETQKENEIKTAIEEKKVEFKNAGHIMEGDKKSESVKSFESLYDNENFVNSLKTLDFKSMLKTVFVENKKATVDFNAQDLSSDNKIDLNKEQKIDYM